MTGRSAKASGFTVRVLLVSGVTVVGLYLLIGSRQPKSSLAATTGNYPYAVGSPGAGKRALPLILPATTGGDFNLASYRGKQNVLLYFQEGLTCQPCWDQAAAIQKDIAKFHALGIGPIASITTDPLNLLKQKAQDEGLTFPVLSDQGARYSTAWKTNRYQMMGMGNRDGHSFILVGKSGRILWRADYGGAPKYTMYVPDDVLLTELRAHLKR
jgi:peroxiredoxin Q/BCP